MMTTRVPGANAARRVAADLVRVCETAIEETPVVPPRRLRAAYIHGSLADGSYVSDRSDIDVLVVVDRPLTDGERSDLVGALDRFAPATGRRFDVTVVTAASASRPNHRPRAEVYYGVRGGPSEVVRGDHLPSLVVEYSALRSSAEVLIGPSPSTLIAEQPPEWIDARGLELVNRWSRVTEPLDHAGLMVLTACRIWRWAADRRHVSKDDAASWVMRHHPGLRAVPAAVAERRGARIEPFEPRDVAEVLDGARRALERRQAPARPGPS